MTSGAPLELIIEFLSDNFFWIVAGSIAIIAIVSGGLTSIITTRSKERSRREIAAYVAEGSMTPEQGEKLMAAHDAGRRCR